MWYVCGPQWTVYEPGLDYFVDKEREAIWWWRGWIYKNYLQSIQYSSYSYTPWAYGRIGLSGSTSISYFFILLEQN